MARSLLVEHPEIDTAASPLNGMLR